MTNSVASYVSSFIASQRQNAGSDMELSDEEILRVQDGTGTGSNVLRNNGRRGGLGKAIQGDKPKEERRVYKHYALCIGAHFIHPKLFRPECVQYDSRGEVLKSKYRPDEPWLKGIDLAPPGSAGDQHYNQVAKWTSQGDLLNKLSRKERNLVNDIKYLLESFECMVWAHNANSDKCAEFGGPHLHVVISSPIDRHGKLVNPTRKNNVRSLRANLEAAGGYLRSERVYSLEAIARHLMLEPRLYLGSNSAELGAEAPKYWRRRLESVSSKEPDSEECEYDDIVGQLSPSQEDWIDCEWGDATTYNSNPDTGDRGWGREPPAKKSKPTDRQFRSIPASYKPSAFAYARRNEPSHTQTRTTGGDVDEPTEDAGSDQSDTDQTFRKNAPEQDQYPMDPNIARGKKLLEADIKETATDRTTSILRYIIEYVSEYQTDLITRACEDLPPNDTVRIKWAKLQHRPGVKRQIESLCEEYRAKFAVMPFRELCERYNRGHCKRRSAGLATVSESIKYWFTWCEDQGMDATRIIYEIVAVMEKIYSKYNSFCLIGPSNGGKSLFLTYPLRSLLPFVGDVGAEGNASAFDFMDCVNQRVIFFSECMIDPTHIDKFKKVCGGEEFKVAVKYTGPKEILRSPVIITGNNPPWRMDYSAKTPLENRMFIHQTKPIPDLKNIKTRIHPSMWLIFLDVLQEDNYQEWMRKNDLQFDYDKFPPPVLTAERCLRRLWIGKDKYNLPEHVREPTPDVEELLQEVAEQTIEEPTSDERKTAPSQVLPAPSKQLKRVQFEVVSDDEPDCVMEILPDVEPDNEDFIVHTTPKGAMAPPSPPTGTKKKPKIINPMKPKPKCARALFQDPEKKRKQTLR